MKTQTSVGAASLRSSQYPALAKPKSLTKITSHGGLTGTEPAGTPRFIPEPHRDAVGSRGGELADYCRDVIKQPLLPWQRDLADLILQVDADGRWCRSTWLLIISRQSGKSTLIRAIAEWLASQGGMVLSASAKLASVQHLMRPTMMRYRTHPDYHVLFRAEQPECNWPNHTENSGRWISQAANSMFGRSFSSSVVIIDEVQDCQPEALAAVRPTLTEVENPLVIMCGTGSRADSPGLLVEQRNIALAGGPVALVEWSAPPGSDWLDENTWREASPRWTPARLRRIRDDVSLGESFVRSEYLCVQVTSTTEPWLDLQAWEQARTDLEIPPVVDVAAVEDGKGGTGGAVALAWSRYGVVHVVALMTDSLEEAWQYAARAERVLCGITLRNEAQAIDLRAKPVGRRETATALPELRRLLTTGALAWDGDQLDEQVRSVIVREDSTGSLAVAPNVPSNVMRAAAWAIQACRVNHEPVLV